jgi:hypothetical protein
MAKKIYNIPEHKTVASTPSTPALGHSKIYPKSDNLWYFLNDAGVETLLGSGEGYVYKIGEYVPSEGGVIFHRYIDNGTQYYLVVDTTDLSTSSAWSNVTGTLIGATAQSTWDGLSNSNAIVGESGFTSGAAKLCLDSTNNSKSDWYLPAIDELSLLWQSRFNVNKTLSGNSSFGSISGATQIFYNAYWSSTEYAFNLAWFFNFSNGFANFANKNPTSYVRAIRKFSITPVFPSTTTTTTAPITTTTTTAPITTTTTTLFPSTTTTTTQNN